LWPFKSLSLTVILYSFSSTSALPGPYTTSQSTESMQSWPLNRNGVAKISSPVKNCPHGRRRKPPRLPTVFGSTRVDGGDDVIPDATSSDSCECASDVRDYFVERRPSTGSVVRRKWDSADEQASSPVNSTGVHIVIDDGNDDVTYGDDVIVVEYDDRSTSGRDAPSCDKS